MGWNLTRATTSDYKKNWIINPDFSISNGQTTFSAVNGAVLPGWAFIHNSDGSYTITQSTDVPTFGSAGRVIPYSMRATVNTADASLSSTQYAIFYHRLSGYTWSNLLGQTMILSFWVKSSVTGTYSVSLQNNTSGGTGDYYIGSYSISSTSTWEFKTITIPVYTSGTWATNANPAAILNFGLGIGTSYQAAAGNWSTSGGPILGVTSQASMLGTNSNIFSLAGVQLEVGTTFSGFETLPEQEHILNLVQNRAAATDESAPDAATSGGILKNLSTFRKNGVLNGEFRLCHETSTVGAAAGGGTQADLLFADYWYYVYSGAMGITYTQSTDAPTAAQAGRVIPYSLRATVTTNDASIGSGDYAITVQRIPGAVWANYAQKPCNISFWVKSTVTGTYAVTITNNLDSYSCVSTYTVNTTNTWEFKTITIPPSPSAGTWDYISTFGYSPYGHLASGGVILNFAYAAGSTFQTSTIGSWQNANFFHTSSSPANGVATNGNIFAITAVQLETGTGFSGYEITEPQLDVIRATHSPTAGGLLTTLGRPRKNFIINGDMDIWQRGTSFASAADQQYTADRWAYAKANDATATISQQADYPSFAISGRVFNYSLRHTLSVADTSIATGQYATIYQKLEGYLWRYLFQRDFTISFWVRGTVTGTYCVCVQASDGGRTIALEYTISTTNTWEFKTIHVPASGSAGNWSFTNGVGCVIHWTIAAGSTFNQGTGQWVSANYLATSNQVNGLSSTANIFAITGVQVELGTGYSGYETRTFEEELAACQRYYWFDSLTNGWIGCYSDAVTGPKSAFIFYRSCPVVMRTTPTVTAVGAASDYRIRYAGAFTNCSDLPTSVNVTSEGINILANLSGSLSTTAGVYLIRTTSTATIKAEAEL